MFASAKPYGFFFFEGDYYRLKISANVCVIAKGLRLRQSAGAPAIGARLNGYFVRFFLRAFGSFHIYTASLQSWFYHVFRADVYIKLARGEQSQFNSCFLKCFVFLVRLLCHFCRVVIADMGVQRGYQH